MMRTASALSLAVFLVSSAFAQTAQPGTQANPDKSSAYYNFAMGHLYAELAGAYGNRGDYVSKAIDHYKAALKADPSAGFLAEELTDLYIQAGRLKDAVLEAETMLKGNPDNLDARRILGRIYTRMIGDSQQGKINDDMLKRSIEQYSKIVEKDPKDTESWLVLGRLYRVAGNSVEAEKSYKKALETDADNEDALTGLAVLYSDVGDTKKAIEMLQLVTTRNPNARTLAALASSYEQMRDYKSAVDVLKKAIEMAPDNPRLKRGLAQDLMLSGQLDEALTSYQQLSKEDPRDAQLQLRISEIYRQKRDFASAQSALAKARSLDPENLEVRYDEVNLLEAQGKSDQAIAVLKKILDDTAKNSYNQSEKSNRVMLLERLGMLYRGANQTQAAVDTFRQIGEVEPDTGSRVAVQIIETYRGAKDYAKAQQEAQAALKKFPDDRLVKATHASLLADQGKIDQAAAELKAVLKGDKDRETLLALAQIYEKGKRYQEMEQVLESAEKASSSDQEKETVFFMRGAMYERQKKFDAAEQEFRKVLQMNPENASALNYLGYMLADRNVRLDEAHKMISRALELDPGNGAYLDSLGWVYFRQNRLDEAETTLLQALEKIGTDPTVHDHLGDVYLKLGKTREAITQWQASIKEWESSARADQDPVEMAKVGKKLESARVKLAMESKGKR